MNTNDTTWENHGLELILTKIASTKTQSSKYIFKFILVFPLGKKIYFDEFKNIIDYFAVENIQQWYLYKKDIFGNSLILSNGNENIPEKRIEYTVYSLEYLAKRLNVPIVREVREVLTDIKKEPVLSSIYNELKYKYGDSVENKEIYCKVKDPIDKISLENLYLYEKVTIKNE